MSVGHSAIVVIITKHRVFHHVYIVIHINLCIVEFIIVELMMGERQHCCNIYYFYDDYYFSKIYL